MVGGGNGDDGSGKWDTDTHLSEDIYLYVYLCDYVGKSTYVHINNLLLNRVVSERIA